MIGNGGENINTKRKISVLALIIMVLLVGCNSSTYMYDEWKSYVVGNKKGNLKKRYEENESEINLKISPYSSKTADECENIIKRSREFAEKNPDYLSDKIDINISFYLGSELIAIKFTNITNAPGDEKSIFYYDLTKLNLDCGEKPSYTYVDYSILQDKVLRGTFDTEVIILELGENAKAYCRADVLELSKYFNSYQCIVANFDAEEPAKEVLQILKEKNPDADIYYTCYRDDLKKYE